MTILEMLGEIERRAVIYSINYRNVGVGFTFYVGPADLGMMAAQMAPALGPPTGIMQPWQSWLKTYQYYPTFEDAVEGEFDRLTRPDMVP